MKFNRLIYDGEYVNNLLFTLFRNADRIKLMHKRGKLTNENISAYLGVSLCTARHVRHLLSSYTIGNLDMDLSLKSMRMTGQTGPILI